MSFAEGHSFAVQQDFHTRIRHDRLEARDQSAEMSAEGQEAVVPEEVEEAHIHEVRIVD